MKIAPIALGLAGVGLVLLAQDSSTIRVTTRLVQLNVIARDKNGPVSDLKKEDFSLFEKGQQRQIASFSMTSAPGLSVVPTGVQMPPNAFSNRFDRSAAAPSTLTVILIDGLNTALLDQKMAVDSTIKVLESLKPDDPVAVYILGTRGLQVLHDFTTDFDHLRTTLRQTKSENSGLLTASNAQPVAPGIGAWAFAGQNEQITTVAVSERARRTTDALTAIARHISVIPGRKNLVWVSGSFPFGVGNNLDARALSNVLPSRLGSPPPPPSPMTIDMQIRQNPPPPSGLQSPQLFTDELRKSWTALNDANVAVYPVDANGLLTSKGSESINTMRLIAEQTGGKAYFNGSDLTGAMRGAMDDGRVSYTVGFYVAASDLDGKFHDIKVRVARAGVDLGHRSGYWATEELPRSDKQIEEDLRTAAARPLEITELGVSARGDMLPGDAPGLRVAVSIDFSDARFEKKDDRWIGKLELFLFQVGADGARLDSTSAVIPLNLTDKSFQRAAREGMLVKKTLKPAPGAQEVRVLVLDRGSGKIGSLRMPMGPILAAAKK